LNKTEHNNSEVILTGPAVANIWPLVISAAVENILGIKIKFQV
jgi:hypothetical protein